MRNKQIDSAQIPHLVRLTADLFRDMRKGVKSPNHNPSNLRNEANNMHFITDLLKDLVDTAYPRESETAKVQIPKVNFPTVCEKRKKIAYQIFKDLLEKGKVPEFLIPTFEEWELLNKSFGGDIK